jgi:hypothetical protein
VDGRKTIAYQRWICTPWGFLKKSSTQAFAKSKTLTS